MTAPNTVSNQFDINGFVLVPNAITQADLARLTGIVEQIHSEVGADKAGVRQLLRTSPELLQYAQTTGAKLVKDVLEFEQAFPVRGILFDKSPYANWYVTWHQDRTIPIAERRETEGFRAWSTKDGTLHVQPPVYVMESMIAIRIHLDDCTKDNGAIKFVPGSHKLGIISEEAIAGQDHTKASVTVSASRGDVIFMRPLILHASSKSVQPRRRRVLHIEYGTQALPDGLLWGLA